ncbi:MAG: hypothetical protein PVF40_09370 [Ectothiorhodospiraceae bacterium]
MHSDTTRIPAVLPQERVTLTTGLVAQARIWGERMRSRRRLRADLQRLDRHLLRDAGLDPVDANREANKPFWRE